MVLDTAGSDLLCIAVVLRQRYSFVVRWESCRFAALRHYRYRLLHRINVSSGEEQSHRRIDATQVQP